MVEHTRYRIDIDLEFWTAWLVLSKQLSELNAAVKACHVPKKSMLKSEGVGEGKPPVR